MQILYYNHQRKGDNKEMSFQATGVRAFKSAKQLKSGVDVIVKHVPEKPVTTNFVNGKQSICNVLSFEDGYKVLKMNLIVIAYYNPDNNTIETLKYYPPSYLRAIKKFAEIITQETGNKPTYDVPDRYKAEVLTT